MTNKDETYKVGDFIANTGFPVGKAPKLVVEQVFARGKVVHYLCSHADENWMPIFVNHDYVRKFP